MVLLEEPIGYGRGVFSKAATKIQEATAEG